MLGGGGAPSLQSAEGPSQQLVRCSRHPTDRFSSRPRVCLCALLSEDVCKRGFTVIIDMRGSKWELIKPLLKTLQEFFPAEICVALIIKPDNFWQKQKTNFGSAKFSFEVSGPLRCL